MGLETATYISGLVATNPLGTDAKSQGDDHLRLLKSTLQATFPNITGALSATHTELNYVTGVTSAIQTQINTKGAIAGQAWTGSHTFPTQSAGDNSTKAATTAYVDTGLALKGALAGATWTGTQSFTGATITVPTQSPSDNTTKAASTAYVDAASFASALPNQAGNSGKFVTTNGTTASWANITNSASAKSANYTVASTDRYKAFDLTSAATLSITAAATLGDGFIFYARNGGTGAWTIDPNASETIDGLTTDSLYPGEAGVFIGDGSNWRSFGRAPRWVQISSVSPAAAAGAQSFTSITQQYEELMLIFEGVTHGGAGLVVDLGNSTPTYSTTLTITAASPVSGFAEVAAVRLGFGAAQVAVSATLIASNWSISGGVRAVRISVSGGSGTFSGAGTIRLLGR